MQRVSGDNFFSKAASDLLVFAKIENVDLDDLEKLLSLDRLRIKHNDPNGTFFGAVPLVNILK